MWIFVSGASDEARTRYLHLGKVALYQMSYTRFDKRYNITLMPICQQLFFAFFKKFLRQEERARPRSG